MVTAAEHQDLAVTREGRREMAKERRRQALLSAAHDALKRNDFSMRKVAELAGFSEVTPYNLFGSKSGLLAALYRDMVRESEARLPPIGSVSALERVFFAIDQFAERLSNDPAFFQAFFGARIDTKLVTAYPIGFDEGINYWYRLIDGAISTGELADGSSSRMMARHFVFLVGGAVQEWLAEKISAEEWRNSVTHGFAMLALAVACPRQLDMLKAKWFEASQYCAPLPLSRNELGKEPGR